MGTREGPFYGSLPYANNVCSLSYKTRARFTHNRPRAHVNKASQMANEQLSTPPACTADFCLIPIGTPTASVSKEVAEVQRLLQKSGLKYSMHSAGTTLGKLGSKQALNLTID